LDARIDFANPGGGGRARFDAIAKPLLRRLPEGSYRETVIDMLREAMRLLPANFEQLLTDAAPPVVAKPMPSGGAKRRTAVQKVINLALHFPHAAAQLASPEQLAPLNQPGSDVLRRVFATAAALGDANAALLLENLRDDPDFTHLERIGAEPPLGIEDEGAAFKELEESLQHLRRDADKEANVQRIRAHRPGAGTD
jgi:DNA primase